MEYTQAEILQTVRMTEMEHLDVRTVTLGLSLRDCVRATLPETAEAVREKIERTAARLVPTVDEIGEELGLRVANKRISITPASLVYDRARSGSELLPLARAIDEAAKRVGVDFIGGYSALVHKGETEGTRAFVDSIPEALATTERLCSSLSLATTRAGINMDAVRRTGEIIKEMAERTRERGGLACAKFVCFANAVEDNPFMAGAFHGVGEPEAVINVGVSGPGVVNHAVRHAPQDAPLDEMAELIKKLSFKLARAGELVGREAARRLGLRFGIIDLSLAPTPTPGDSVGEILEALGFERGRRDERRLHPRLGGLGDDRGGAARGAHVGEARGDDERLLRGARHGG